MLRIFPQWVIAERMGEPVIRRGTKLAFVPTRERKIKQRDQMTNWRKTNRRGLRLEEGKKQREKWISFPPTLFLFSLSFSTPLRHLIHYADIHSICFLNGAPSFPPHSYKDTHTHTRTQNRCRCHKYSKWQSLAAEQGQPRPLMTVLWAPQCVLVRNTHR